MYAGSVSRIRLPALLLLIATAHCGGGELDTPGAAAAGSRDPVVLGGRFALRVTEAPFGLELVRGDATLVTFGADAFQLGTVAVPSDKENYDPWFMAVGKHQADPEGLAFVSPSAAKIVSREPLVVSLTYAEGKATLTASLTAEGRFQLSLVPDVPRVTYFRLAPRVDRMEGLYGLGENYDSVDNRGKIRPMQLEIGTVLESNYTLTHAPIPFVTGTRGWGFYVASEYPGVFDVAVSDPDAIVATFGHGLASPSGITFHLFAADHPLDVQRRYLDLTGQPRLPARWALGPWLWRDGNVDQTKATSDLDTMRKLDLAHTGMWLDNPFKSAVESFEFSPKMFTDPKALVAHANGLGFRMAVWSSPYLDPKAEGTKALVAEATQKGFFPPQSFPISQWGTPFDFTNPDARAWWQAHLVAGYRDVGIEGYKLDYGEEVVPGLAGARTNWKFFDGTDERTGHARYGALYHRTYQETLDPAGSFLLCRHGNPGDQVNVSIMWPGDLDTTWAKTGDPAVDEDGKSYVSVGGFPASIIAGLTLSASGFPFYAADTAGYLHAPADKELFVRWFQQTALSTVMQVGNQASTVAWEKVKDYDGELLAAYREATRLHLRLFPYLWTHAGRLAKDGRPITRSLGLAYPELGVHPDDVYLLGDDLLVAPVVTPGATSRTFTLPPGDWVSWWTGERLAGPGEKTVDAPLTRIPLFVRAGGIIPMLRPTIDTLNPTTATGLDDEGGPLVDSYATTPGVVWVRIAAGGAESSKLTVFDGTTLAFDPTSTTLGLRVEPGAELTLGARFEVLAVGAAPASVTLDGAPLAKASDEAALDAGAAGWLHDAAMGGRLLVKVGPGKHDVVATR